MEPMPVARAEYEESVPVAAGPYLSGEEQTFRYLPPFEIDRYPVTVARYARFLDETGHPPPVGWSETGGDPARAHHPVTGVTWFDAWAFARWAGRVLPTEEQWEKAARGTDGRLYPWGDRFNVRNLNSRAARRRDTTPVDRYPDGVSPYGVMDLAGNVWEWTDSWFDGAGDLKVLKGGCYTLTKTHAAATVRYYNAPWIANRLVGFRTAANPAE